MRAGKGVDLPVALRSNGHNICMAGKTEIRCSVAQPRIKIVDWRCAVFFKGQARAGKAQSFQRALQHVERAGIFRGDGRAPDEVGGKLDGIEGHISAAKGR